MDRVAQLDHIGKHKIEELTQFLLIHVVGREIVLFKCYFALLALTHLTSKIVHCVLVPVGLLVEYSQPVGLSSR